MQTRKVPQGVFIVVLLLTGLFTFSQREGVTASSHTIWYNAVIPEGKLPWPHHDPKISQEEYEDLLDDLCIINNYGQYQCGDTEESAYFHDGLDVVLDNGTKIYAIKSGYVKAIDDRFEYYRGITIADTEGDLPGEGWKYMHTDNFQVSVGDYVPQGTYIADIHFKGIIHLHLERVRLSSGSWENSSDTIALPLDDFFVYKDGQPPYIETPFYYFRNNSDEPFPHGNPTVVSGKVDIVVGMREAGQYTHIHAAQRLFLRQFGFISIGYGDRLCITCVEYEVTRPDGQSRYHSSFDFSQIALKDSYRGHGGVLSVYKFYPVLHPGASRTGDKEFSYYIITNTDGTGVFDGFPFSDEACCWDTTATLRGAPLYPDGEYTITVIAYDYMGNKTTKVDRVRVHNGR